MREAHDALSAEDKALERAFRRDFLDAPEFIDVLHKLYKRRRTVSTGVKGNNSSDANCSSGPGLGSQEDSAVRKKLSKEPTSPTLPL